MEGENPTLVFNDNISNNDGLTDLAIGAAAGSARFVTNDGIAFFIDADNNQSDTKRSNDFRVLAYDHCFCSTKDVMKLSAKGEMNLYAANDLSTSSVFSILTDNQTGNGVGSTGFVKQFSVHGNGYVYAREVNVYSTGLTIPDYVFDKSYKLRTLAEVENYITTNKHLPNVPSAKEIQDKGTLSLTDMNLKLLEKVEELTLYMIEQNKKVEAQNKRIAELEKSK